MTLAQLARLRERWEKARVKDSHRREKALNAIDNLIANRQGTPIRCALPKKQQRRMGLIPKA